MRPPLTLPLPGDEPTATAEQTVTAWCREIFGVQACGLMLRKSDVTSLLNQLAHADWGRTP